MLPGASCAFVFILDLLRIFVDQLLPSTGNGDRPWVYAYAGGSNYWSRRLRLDLLRGYPGVLPLKLKTDARTSLRSAYGRIVDLSWYRITGLFPALPTGNSWQKKSIKSS